MYMSDVAEGGYTYFPKHGGELAKDGVGLRVEPRQQKVIMFYSMHPNGELDPDSVHGGSSVVQGTKWSANLWFWSSKMGYRPTSVAEKASTALSHWEEHRDRLEEEILQNSAGLGSLGSPRSEL
eukprot:SRR837773.15466.p1 GENE.SRR837773.15466~~SRR837773.15466.p1  ORF type:complete len:124 (-),score=32.04 SRR837773.15466:70-441(-)